MCVIFMYSEHICKIILSLQLNNCFGAVFDE